MMNPRRLFLNIMSLAALIIFSGCGSRSVVFSDILSMKSPDGALSVRVGLTSKGEPFYALDRGGEPVILPSKLGFDLMDGSNLKEGFQLLSVAPPEETDETWNPVWGEEREIRNHFNEMSLTFDKDDGAIMRVVFRLYDEGLGFRYEFPGENKLSYFNIKEELTEFAMTGNHLCWWISGDYDTQEYNYTQRDPEPFEGNAPWECLPVGFFRYRGPDFASDEDRLGSLCQHP